MVGSVVLSVPLCAAISDNSDGDVNGLPQPQKGAAMATKAVSFTIAYNATYAERRQSLIDAIRRQATGNTWEETTSFMLLKSSRTAEDLLNTIYYGSQANAPLGDKILVIDVATGTHAAVGMEYPSLLGSLFPLRQLGGLFGNALVGR
jgi:hypothetical protein